MGVLRDAVVGSGPANGADAALVRPRRATAEAIVWLRCRISRMDPCRGARGRTQRSSPQASTQTPRADGTLAVVAAGALALDVLLGILIIALGSIAVGATAPRWPDARLRRDRGPLRLMPGDTPERYERLGAGRLKRFFPEMGTVFGGVSKSIPPDLGDPVSIRTYLIEVRRAEWVHWLSILTWLPLPLFQPWWLAGAFLLPTVLVNGSAQIILRYNRVRLYGLLDASGAAREG